MTETAHSPNVKGIETTATYYHQSKTSAIHTPHEMARKEYISRAGLHGRRENKSRSETAEPTVLGGAARGGAFGIPERGLGEFG